MKAPLESYPLSWPAGRPRKKYPTRAQFGDHSFEKARKALSRELDLLRAEKLILSTNIPLRLDGMPYATFKPPVDKGVAIYFMYRKRPMVFACDEWDRIEHNVWAIAKTIEALRGVERWGSGDMLERAFTGFMALPQPSQKKHWREVLGFMAGANATVERIKEKRNDLAHHHHPDRGGNPARMAEVNLAFVEAMKELGET